MLALIAACGALVPACAKEEEDHGYLQAADFKEPEGLEVPFDRDLVIETALFVDPVELDALAVERFLRQTPYERPSFLETYQSNGVRAADAIARAAVTYRINPLVFLVYAQAAQGLIGEASYPFPPERVEYAFGCGCLQGDNCVPELAGFDRQVDCLGRKLRVALDQMSTEGATTAGWGQDRTTLTLDNVPITPLTEATAALYDLTPKVAEGKAGGTWMFWNLWTLYSFATGYVGPGNEGDF